ncbi:MAG: acylphosphatase [Burkholderiales bacterium]|nr:acylphosphatase [Burkholderiales bacterium]MDE2453668.1 acylphosphatase [Burkholderiales bacterium]
MAERALRLEIRGRVQGVGYRWSMVQQARALGLGGWVRNRRDGSVEALVSGPAEALVSIQAWARRGPTAAAVESVEVHEAEGGFDSFEPRPSA